MSLLLNLFNQILTWFDIIPKLTYFILACFMSIMDIFQYMIRKLIGLDTYYLSSSNDPQTGDIALAFLRSIFDEDTSFPAIRNAFWALVILGVILLIVTTIIAIIRQEYMPGKDKNNKVAILGRSIKSLFLFMIVPVSAIFGLMLSDIFLQAMDKVTTSSGSSALFSNSTITSKLQSTEVNGTTSYTYYDIFMGALPTNSTSFSGSMFKTAGFTANRVRLNYNYDGQSYYNLVDTNQLSNFGIFDQATSDTEMAEMIDDAFANNIFFEDGDSENLILGVMKNKLDSTFWGVSSSFTFSHFSKFNVALVWYYYDLWQFNFIVGFAFLIVTSKIFANIAVGMAKRIIELVALFIISPPIVAIMPLDDGKVFQSWRKAFVARALSAYGVIFGFNVLFLILPYLNLIKLFPDSMVGAQIINLLFSTVFIILGLQLIEEFMSMFSKMLGAEDVNASGGKLVAQVGETVKKAAMLAAAATGVGVGAVAGIAKGAGAAGKAIGKGIRNHKLANETPEQKAKREAKEAKRQQSKDKRKESFDNIKGGISNAYNKIMGLGTGKQTKAEEQRASNDWERGEGDKAYNDLLNKDEKYNKEIDKDYDDYKIKNGEMSKEDWLKSDKSKQARENAEKRYAYRTGTDRKSFKENNKNDYVKGRANSVRKNIISQRQQRIAGALLNTSGIKNTQTIGELFTEQMKDTFVRGGKGGFPAMIKMFSGGLASDVEKAGIKKKIQKQQQATTKIQMEVQKELEKKSKK